uniref:Fibronectin type-III domain-containing protein n=1 Tax=Callorhinchus milii TaxID=7868 RepID=A0A4W3JY16_CALMI
MSSSHNQSQHQFVFGTGRQHTFPSSGSTAQGTAGLKDHNQATIILLPPEVKKSPPSQQMTNRGQLHPSTMVATERSKTPLSVLATFTTAKQVVPVFLVSEDEHSESLKEGEEIKEKSEHMQAGECNYDPCRHWQVPCHDLQLLTGCSCPTMTGEDVKPKPAKIQKVLKISDRSGEIYWCAPNSVVLHYYIIYQSDENKHLYKTDIINPTYRRYTLHDLASDTTYHVCVIAVNKAGTSPSSTIWPQCPTNSRRLKMTNLLLFLVLEGLLLGCVWSKETCPRFRPLPGIELRSLTCKASALTTELQGSTVYPAKGYLLTLIQT